MHRDEDLFPPTMTTPAPPIYRVRCVVCGQACPRVFLDGIDLCALCATDDTQLQQARDAYHALVARLERQSERWFALIAELPDHHLERWQRVTTAVMLGTDAARVRATLRQHADLKPYYDGLRAWLAQTTRHDDELARHRRIIESYEWLEEVGERQHDGQ
jgi:hypothetical protein